jgi:hypothetical protein
MYRIEMIAWIYATENEILLCETRFENDNTKTNQQQTNSRKQKSMLLMMKYTEQGISNETAHPSPFIKRFVHPRTKLRPYLTVSDRRGWGDECFAFFWHAYLRSAFLEIYDSTEFELKQMWYMSKNIFTFWRVHRMYSEIPVAKIVNRAGIAQSV